jgi:hypothetical protein
MSPLPDPFFPHLVAGKWNQVAATIRIFVDEQMDFDMGANELIKLTGLSLGKVQQIISIISRNNNERFSVSCFFHHRLTSAVESMESSSW